VAEPHIVDRLRLDGGTLEGGTSSDGAQRDRRDTAEGAAVLADGRAHGGDDEDVDGGEDDCVRHRVGIIADRIKLSREEP